MKLQHIFTICCLIFGLLCPVSAKSLSSEKIVFSSNRDGNWEIYIMNPDGTRQEKLTYDRAVDCEPVISPKGDQIVFTSNRGGTRDLYLMDVDGRNLRPLFGFSDSYRTQPVWSPNGQKIAYSPLENRIAFVWFRPAEKQQSIFIAKRDGSYLRKIGALIANAPAWAPFGNELIYTEGVIGSNSQIFKINLTHQTVRQLTGNGSNHSGNWFTPKQLPVSLSTSLLTTQWGQVKVRD